MKEKKKKATERPSVRVQVLRFSSKPHTCRLLPLQPFPVAQTCGRA